jgi:hypothetical protein
MESFKRNHSEKAISGYFSQLESFRMESFRRNLSKIFLAKPESFRMESFRKNLSERNLSERI